jgi:hypothetical protein
VAGRSAAVFDRTWGALNGALVFLIAVPIGLWLMGQGFGAVMGTMTNLSAALGMNANQVAANAQATANSVTPYDVAQAAERARTAAVVALLGMICGFVAAAVGGAFGTRRTLEVERDTNQVTDVT